VPSLDGSSSRVLDGVIGRQMRTARSFSGKLAKYFSESFFEKGFRSCGSKFAKFSESVTREWRNALSSSFSSTAR